MHTRSLPTEWIQTFPPAVPNVGSGGAYSRRAPAAGPGGGASRSSPGRRRGGRAVIATAAAGARSRGARRHGRSPAARRSCSTCPGPPVHGGNAAVVRRRPASACPPATCAWPSPGRWSPTARPTRARTLAALERLPQRNPAVVFALGMAQLWAGQPQTAELTLERVKRLDPYGFYGTNADNLLHLGHEAPGYPPYFPPTPSRGSLRRAAGGGARRTRPAPGRGSRSPRGLERTDGWRRCATARRAADLEPPGHLRAGGGGRARVQQGRPMASVGTMLARSPRRRRPSRTPRCASTSGLVYFWIKEGQDAAGEFRQVAAGRAREPLREDRARVRAAASRARPRASGLPGAADEGA